MLHQLVYKSILLIWTQLLITGCVDGYAPVIKNDERVNAEILMLYKKINILETQLQKCDNWVKFLEEE